jgi:hypothetical protein
VSTQDFFDTLRQALRTALFPLISGQHKRRAFFEPPDWPADCPPPDDAEVWACLYTATEANDVVRSPDLCTRLHGAHRRPVC